MSYEVEMVRQVFVAMSTGVIRVAAHYLARSVSWGDVGRLEVLMWEIEKDRKRSDSASNVYHNQ